MVTVSLLHRYAKDRPSVRQLAADLTVHHNTVAEAYRILAAEGWLDLRQGCGEPSRFLAVDR